MTAQPMTARQPRRTDWLVIAGMVENGAKVLDIGCGDGELLQLLATQNQVDGRGMEMIRPQRAGNVFHRHE